MPSFAKRLTPSVSPKVLAAWEIGSVLVSALIAEWTMLACFGRSRWVVIVPFGLALALMVVSHRAYAEKLTDLGFRFDNFVAALRLIALPTIAFMVLVL